MSRKYKKRNLALLAALLALFLAGCGSDSYEAYGERLLTVDLVKEIPNSVWHDGLNIINVNEIDPAKAQTILEPLILLEDGSYYRDVMLIRFGSGLSNLSVFGIYQVDILDADRVTFKAKVGLPYSDTTDGDPLVFRLMLQESNEFPVLFEEAVSYDGTLHEMEVDLSPYRGRNKFLILSVESPMNMINPMDGAWVSPAIIHEFID